MDIENINSNIQNPAMQDDERVEQLLSERLMEGYVLLEKSCPACYTPLVKDFGDDDDEPMIHKEIEPIVYTAKESFIEPFVPVQGVPLCVGCTSHVVFQENEAAILAGSGIMKIKGGFMVVEKPAEKAIDLHEDSQTAEVESVPPPPVVEPEIIDLNDASEMEVEPVPAPKQPEIIDVTLYDETLEDPITPSHVEEKKEEEEIVEPTMVEYSIRYVFMCGYGNFLHLVCLKK